MRCNADHSSLTQYELDSLISTKSYSFTHALHYTSLIS